ncbi:MAG: signal peptidase I [Actinomycetota bacterium]
MRWLTGIPLDRVRRAAARPDQLARLVAGFVAYLYLAVVLLLGAWLVVISLTTGWRPVVITGGSMLPTLRVGDVLLVEDHPDGLLGQRSVITFEPTRGDGAITHRIHEVLPESQTYLTKGDANADVDSDPVSPSQVLGVGRLVIPLLGLPVIWGLNGDWPALAAIGVLSIGAVVIVVSNAVGDRSSNRSGSGRTSEMANRGIRRVRFLAGLMIVSGLYLDGSSIEEVGWGPGRNQVVALTLAVLIAVNLISTTASSRGRHLGRDGPPDWLVLAELGADTVLAGVLIALTGGSGIAWAFIALPIVEAAVRFRLVGALLHWVLMTLLTVGARLFALDRGGVPLSEIINELEQLLDQLGILLLLVIPGAYLTEQLVTDVIRQDRATAVAIERARLLEKVAETGYELNRIGNELFQTLTRAVTSLGFDLGDAHLLLPDGRWKALAASPIERDRALPEPGEAGSGLRTDDLGMNEVLVDHDDPELSEVLSLQAHDLEMLARLTVSTEEGRHVVVRAANLTGSGLRAGSIDALRLLTGQAAVAMQNEQLVDELQGVQEELAQQALHDALTGLPNRAQFLDRLERGLAMATDPERRHVVMFMDLNGFKAINDSLGHDAGDALLIGVAGRLTSAVADDGLVARLGGDEFTVLLEPVADINRAMAVAQRIHDAVAEPFQLGDERAEVSGSIGLAPAELGLGGSEILRRADVAMYAAKSSRATPRITIYHASLDGQDQRRGRLSAEFVKALEAGELHLVYQPLVDRDGDIRGVEALLRWTHREMGPVSTATILELAEAADRVDELAAFIFGTATASIAGLGIPRHVDFTLAVNVTPTELGSPNLVELVRQSLADSRLGAERLIIELNERVVADGEGSLDNIHRVVAMGVRLALDDFGEGRTSLGHLRGLPISQLKLDLGLVQQAAESDSDRIILDSMVGLAHDLQFEVVAEGIETEKQLEVVLGAGADLLQGYGLYRPMELDRLRRVLGEFDLTGPVTRALPLRPPTGPGPISATRPPPMPTPIVVDEPVAPVEPAMPEAPTRPPARGPDPPVAMLAGSPGDVGPPIDDPPADRRSVPAPPAPPTPPSRRGVG